MVLLNMNNFKTDLFNSQIEPWEDQGVMVIPRALELEPNHQMQFSVIAKTSLSERVLPPSGDAVCVL